MTEVQDRYFAQFREKFPTVGDFGGGYIESKLTPDQIDVFTQALRARILNVANKSNSTFNEKAFIKECADRTSSFLLGLPYENLQLPNEEYSFWDEYEAAAGGILSSTSVLHDALRQRLPDQADSALKDRLPETANFVRDSWYWHKDLYPFFDYGTVFGIVGFDEQPDLWRHMHSYTLNTVELIKHLAKANNGVPLRTAGDEFDLKAIICAYEIAESEKSESSTLQ